MKKEVESESESKTLSNTDIATAKAAVPDIKVFGDGDTWRLLCKASSEKEGWMKSTKVLEVPLTGCFVQVTTQQRNADGSYVIAESVTFAPHTALAKNTNGVWTLVAA